jgi:amidohydrolase
VTIIEKYDPTINDEALTELMLPTLRWAANGDVVRSPLVGAAEDFSFFAKQAPGLFFFLGITPRDQDLAKAAPNHSPEFFIDEAALIVGMRALAGLAVDYGSTGPNSALPEVSGAPSARPSGQ